MTSDTRTSAATAVFGTPELLEMILLFVTTDWFRERSFYEVDSDDPKTTLLSQRVSRAFRETVQGSKKLLHELFTGPAAKALLDVVVGFPTSDHTPLRLSEDKRFGVVMYTHYYSYCLRISQHYHPDALDRDAEGSWRHIVLPRPRFEEDCRIILRVYVYQSPEHEPRSTSREREWREGETVGDVVAELIEMAREKDAEEERKARVSAEKGIVQRFAAACYRITKAVLGQSDLEEVSRGTGVRSS